METWLRNRRIDAIQRYEGKPPPKPSKPVPTPWIVVQEMIGKEWGIPAFAIPRREDHADPLSDAVGRWLEYRALQDKYALG